MFYYVYIFQSKKNNSLYIGFTKDLKARINSHNSGNNESTKPFYPYDLIFFEAFKNIIDAKNREEYLKSGFGRRSISKMLKKHFEK